MMVSPVSFRATSASGFQDMIKKPQAYTQQPIASTSIEGEKKKGSVGKKILGVALGATAIAGLMVAVSKNSAKIGELISKIKNEKIANFAKTANEKVSGWGNAISSKVGQAYNAVKGKGSELLSKINKGKTAEETAEKVVEKVVDEVTENIQPEIYL